MFFWVKQPQINWNRSQFLQFLLVDFFLPFFQISNLRTKIQKAEEWLDKLRKVFLKKGWFWTLQEVLLPRTEELTKITFKDLKDRKKRVKELEIKNVRVSDDGFFEDFKRLSSEEVWKLERNELKLFNQIRTKNETKLKNESSSYCICQRGAKSVNITVGPLTGAAVSGPV